MWWWEKAIEAVRVEAVVGAQSQARNPVRSYLAAIVLLHAALRGELDGVRAIDETLGGDPRRTGPVGSALR